MDWNCVARGCEIRQTLKHGLASCFRCGRDQAARFVEDQIYLGLLANEMLIDLDPILTRVHAPFRITLNHAVDFHPLRFDQLPGLVPRAIAEFGQGAGEPAGFAGIDLGPSTRHGPS